MKIKIIDGHILRKAIIAGAIELERNKDYIDSLNVFPVPDGDTGTNMSLTVLAAAREVEKLNTPNAGEVSRALSGGSLRGARGNSGVILSQLFRGFAKGLENKELANADDVALAFRRGMETAYKAVMKPKEGTILTIAKAMSERAREVSIETDDLEILFREVLEQGKKVLAQTQQMLPQLKQAGVVDAGAKGLLCFLEAAVNSYYSQAEFKTSDAGAKQASQTGQALASAGDADIKFGYCTEFFINVKGATEQTENDLKKYLDGIGDSIVVVGDEELIKVHVHSNHPGLIIERALKIGQLENLKIDNMRLQHTSKINFAEMSEEEPENGERKDVGFVAVSMGSGIDEAFFNLGVDKVIEGGQTMNPSTEDILYAIHRVNADNVIILPNNKNIILAAEQAAKLSEDKKITVLPTKTIPQGISAMVAYAPDAGLEENIGSMRASMAAVKTGLLTYAVRDTYYEDKTIRQGNVLGIVESNIEIVTEDVQEGAKKLLDMMIEQGSFVSIFYGEEVNEQQAEELYNYVVDNYPDSDAEMNFGAQPLYYYIFSVE